MGVRLPGPQEGCLRNKLSRRKLGASQRSCCFRVRLRAVCSDVWELSDCRYACTVCVFFKSCSQNSWLQRGHIRVPRYALVFFLCSNAACFFLFFFLLRNPPGGGFSETRESC